MLDIFLQYFKQYENILALVGLISVLVFVITLLLTPYLLGLIPADYFARAYQASTCSTGFNFVKTSVKSLLGLVLLIGGIIMLFTPGQGVVSILLGLFLLKFPGKRKLELKLIQHNPTFNALNWLRGKAGKSPFLRE